MYPGKRAHCMCSKENRCLACGLTLRGQLKIIVVNHNDGCCYKNSHGSMRPQVALFACVWGLQQERLHNIQLPQQPAPKAAAAAPPMAASAPLSLSIERPAASAYLIHHLAPILRQLKEEASVIQAPTRFSDHNSIRLCNKCGTDLCFRFLRCARYNFDLCPTCAQLPHGHEDLVIWSALTQEQYDSLMAEVQAPIAATPAATAVKALAPSLKLLGFCTAPVPLFQEDHSTWDILQCLQSESPCIINTSSDTSTLQPGALLKMLLAQISRRRLPPQEAVQVLHDGVPTTDLSLSEFFAHYDGPIKKDAYTLKDVPAFTTPEKLHQPTFEASQDAMPDSSLTHRDGVLNLAAHLPTRVDLQAKAYLGVNANSGTKYHQDVTDAINVLVAARPHGAGPATRDVNAEPDNSRHHPAFGSRGNLSADAYYHVRRVTAMHNMIETQMRGKNHLHRVGVTYAARSMMFMLAPSVPDRQRTHY